MSKTELLRRCLILVVLLFIIVFGISIITRSNLETSPISSIPYVASFNTPLPLVVSVCSHNCSYMLTNC